MRYPKPFEELMEGFRKLPGVGAKTAERYAFQALEWRPEHVSSFMEALQKSHEQIHDCAVCGNMALEDKCEICKSAARDQDTICVVTSVKDIIAIEKTNEYNGVYHVLHGEISSSKGILPDDIHIKELLARVTDTTKEVIVATNPTMDGETTALYLIKLLEQKNTTVSRLAHGLPMGGHLDYADELTLIKAMEGRKKIKE